MPGPPPAGRYRNSIKGEAVDSGGNRYRIRAEADFRAEADGSLEFKPTFLFGLRFGLRL